MDRDYRELHIGDLVMLKSGGQVMTVTNIFDHDAVVCWFDNYLNEHGSRFPIGALVHVRETHAGSYEDSPYGSRQGSLV